MSAYFSPLHYIVSAFDTKSVNLNFTDLLIGQWRLYIILAFVTICNILL